MSQASAVSGRALAAALVLCALIACGKKGPPLAPLRPVPAAVAELAARRAGDEVRFSFRLPVQNADGSKPVSLERAEVYAVTVGADAAVPANRDLLVPKYLVATIPVRPVPVEGQPAEPAGAAPASPDPRPAPGEVTNFVEELNEAKLKPQVVAPAAVANQALPTTTAVISAAAAALGRQVPVVTRVYVIRGVSLNGRPGQPSERVTLPVAALPAPPTGVTASFTPTAINLTWLPPVAADVLSAFAPAPLFNVYTGTGTVPLNDKPLSTTAFTREGVTFGTEECFTVRTALTSGNITIESPASAPVCVTPADTFPPAAPTGVSVAGSVGAINLIWNANTESDLGGYIVLRGEAPGDKLQAITATPITETTYRDTAVTPGVRYVYAIVAVDRATPPNTSPQSIKVEETAR